MNLRPSSNPSLAAAWPLVEAGMDRVARALHPRQEPLPLPPRRFRSVDEAVTQIVALLIGQSITLYRPDPSPILRRVEALCRNEYLLVHNGGAAWRVERTA